MSSQVLADETAAREIAAVRALDSRAAPELWSAEDRASVSRAAAEALGENAAPEAFLTMRAHIALERIGRRSDAFARAVRATRWRPWVGVAIVVAAFVAGIAIDEVGGGHRINLLAPPFFLLLAWNIAVYAALVVRFVAYRSEGSAAGPLRRLLTRWAGGGAPSQSGEAPAIVASFLERWTSMSARLYQARAARILHFAAAVFAAGLVAGLYVRGLALEYRATWESTFLGARSVHALLAAVFAPGAAIAGMPLPALDEITAIRSPASENAARWLHLIAATVALIVVAPRLLLALAAWVRERRHGSRIVLALDEPYFARLLREYRGVRARVRIVPYSYALPPAESLGIDRIVRRAFGANAEVTVDATVAYGGEEACVPGAPADGTANVIALFNATATPEPDAHGAFLGVLGARATPRATIVALIDEGSFRERFGSDPRRLEDRRASWRALCGQRHVPCVFVALRASDLDSAVHDLERAFETDVR